MGTDPWGAVMMPTGASLPTVVTEACGNAVPEKSTTPPHSTLSHTQLSTTTLTYSSQVPAVSLVLSVSSVTLPLTTSHSASSTHAVQSIKTQAANAPVHAAVSGPPPSKPPSQPAPAKAIAPPSQQPAASNGGSSSGGGSDNSVENSMLSAHNSFRASHGAPAMTWSNNLAAAAQSWANGCKFKHSGGTLGPFGENLAAGTGSSYTANTGFDDWIAEEPQYNPNNPQPSHFTQVVWKGSTQLGCAVSTCEDLLGAGTGSTKYLVCEYFPQGNVIGNFPENVQA